MRGTDYIAVAVVLCGVFGVVAAIMLVIGQVSGWRRMARLFPAQRPAPDADKGLGSLEFAPLCGYNNCILWRADDDYLHLRVMPPFNVFHPAISIPWVEVAELRPSWSGVWLTLPGRKWTVSKKMARRELVNRELLARADAEENPGPGRPGSLVES
jgi:hypothetical protein